MKVLITGVAGQVGSSLVKSAPASLELVKLTRTDMDIADRDLVMQVVNKLRPDIIINAAAYTAVDRAEQEPELAHAINGAGAGNLAEAARECDARFMHISTDFVFDGHQSRPYLTSDNTRPLGVYGASKLEGELRVKEMLGEHAFILRTAWVYAVEGANFVKTMLRLMREHRPLRVVADQIGSPTWAMSLAEAVWKAALQTHLYGLHHWTDAGVASWYDFAVAIGEEATVLKMLKAVPTILPINTDGYPTPARRPAYSVLDCNLTRKTLDMQPAYWRANLRKMLEELKHA